jgi:hypothetical protein
MIKKDSDPDSGKDFEQNNPSQMRGIIVCYKLVFYSVYFTLYTPVT